MDLNSMQADIDSVLVRKSVKQNFKPSPRLLSVMEGFRQMVNDCIRIGIERNLSSLKSLSSQTYGELKQSGGYSRYRLTAISKAAGILSSRKKSMRRGFPTKEPYVARPILVDCYGFKVEGGCLRIHLDAETFEMIPLNAHTLKVLSDPALTVRSVTLTERSLSLCISKEVKEIEVGELTSTVGVDRNLRNLTVGNEEKVTYYDMSKIIEIVENTRSVVKSFKRNDVRIRQRISSKYGIRKRERVKQLLHRVSKDIVQNAKNNRQAIVFEDIKGLRNMYRKGNGQYRSYRSRMNSWPFAEIKRQIEYKAAWEGVPVITLTKAQTKGTTMDCPRCGERLQVPVRGDTEHRRQLWCDICKRWEDRDLCAVLNISRRGRVRFARSSGKGEAGEAVKRNPTTPVILRVDASKLTKPQGRGADSHQVNRTCRKCGKRCGSEYQARICEVLHRSK